MGQELGRTESLEPKKYKAIYTVPQSDPFAAGNRVEVQGYYVKHITATPYAISTEYEHDKFVEEHTKHYIVSDGFSDWGLPRQMEIREIDISTLEEV